MAGDDLGSECARDTEAAPFERDETTTVTVTRQSGVTRSTRGEFAGVVGRRASQDSAVGVEASGRSYLSSNSWMSWPIFAYQSLSIRCMSSAMVSGSVGLYTW